MNSVVSIVVPIYNMEKYLNRCILSIINQTYKNLQIILVNDGSNDTSKDICDDWAKKDSRISVITKVNEGLGKARNTGLEFATGKYVLFVDSDDYISSKMISDLINLINYDEFDLINFGYNRVNEKEELLYSNIPNVKKKIYQENEIKQTLLPNFIGPDYENSYNSKLHLAAWSTMYNVNFLKGNNLNFVSEREIIAEDVYSLTKMYAVSKKVLIVNQAYYYYCDNAGSLTNVFRKDRYSKIKYFYLTYLNLINGLGLSDDASKRSILPFFSFTISCLKMIASADISFKNKLFEIEKILNDDVMINNLKKLPIKKLNFKKKVLFNSMKKRNKFIVFILCKFGG